MKNIFGRTAENWYLEELPQGTKVRFNDSVNQGTGTICGISGNGVPIAGKSYIIQLDNMIEGFAYSHISLPEIYLEVIDTEGERHKILKSEKVSDDMLINVCTDSEMNEAINKSREIVAKNYHNPLLGRLSDEMIINRDVTDLQKNYLSKILDTSKQ